MPLIFLLLYTFLSQKCNLRQPLFINTIQSKIGRGISLPKFVLQWEQATPYECSILMKKPKSRSHL